MKIYFYISVAASALCLVLSVVLFIFGNINQGLQTEVQTQQTELQKQQEEINKANQISQQIGPAILRDMGMSSIKNEKMKVLLAKHGYTVNMPSPSPGGAAPKAPAAPATAPDSAPGRLQP